MPEWFKKLIAFAVLAGVILFVAKVNWLDRETEPLPGLYLGFQAQSTVNSSAKVILDDGMQIECRISKSDTFLSYQVPLQEGDVPLAAIRIDPLMDSGLLTIRNLEIADTAGRLRIRLGAGEMESLNPQAHIIAANGELRIERNQPADYPVLLLKNIFPIRTAKDMLPRVTLAGLSLVVGMILIGVLLGAWMILRALAGAPRLAVWTISAFCIILGARLYTIHLFGASYHRWDSWDWEAWGLYLPFLDGTLSWKTMFLNANEHRVFFARVESLVLFLINGQWDNRFEAAANALLYSAIIVGFALMLCRTLGERWQGWVFSLVILASALPFAWENTVWGYQSQFYYFMGFSLLAIWLLGMHRPFSARWLTGLTMAVCSNFTVGSGITPVYVVAGLMIYKLIRDPHSWRDAVITLAACGLLFAFLNPFAITVHNYGMMTKTLDQFISSFGKTMSWPFVYNRWLWLFLWSPAVIFFAEAVWKRRKMLPSEGLLFMLAIWCLISALGIGIYRGGFSGGPLSRYMDMTSLSLVVNGLCACLLIARLAVRERFGRWIRGGAVAWCLTMGFGLILLTHLELSVDAVRHALKSRAGAAIVTQFLRENQIGLLLQKRKEIFTLYPNSFKLATYLRCPRIRAILPASIREPLPLEFATSTFISPGTDHDSVPDLTEQSWGSYMQRGGMDQAILISRPLPQRRFPFLEFKATESLRFNPRTLYLRVKNISTGRITPALPEMYVGGDWITATVRCPAGQVVIEAADLDSVGWFAFCAPREKSSSSVITDFIVTHSLWILWIGIAGIVGTALWKAFSRMAQAHLDPKIG